MKIDKVGTRDQNCFITFILSLQMLDDKIKHHALPEADGYDHITHVLTTHNRHKTSVPATHNCKDCHSKMIAVTMKLYPCVLLLVVLVAGLYL